MKLLMETIVTQKKTHSHNRIALKARFIAQTSLESHNDLILGSAFFNFRVSVIVFDFIAVHQSNAFSRGKPFLAQCLVSGREIGMTLWIIQIVCSGLNF